MFDYKLITSDEYNLYIYGTTNQKKIELAKTGLSVSLISRLEEADQLVNIQLDEFNNLQTTEKFETYLSTVNDFYRFEIKRFFE